jgi:hypothetical protein
VKREWSRAMKRRRDRFIGKKLLLMGSKAFQAKGLPVQLTRKIDEAIERKMKIVVGEAPGACRLYQDYLKRQNYANVVVGHAKSIRYNAGNWKAKQYGGNVSEREKNMINECESAVVIWQDNSGVIAENLEILKRSGKPTFLYEYTTKTRVGKAGWLDPNRIYDPYYNWTEYMRRKKEHITSKVMDKARKS